MRKLIVFSGFIFTTLITIQSLLGQIVVSSGEDVTPVDLVETLLGEGLQYSNVQYQGADSAKGIFTNGQTTNLGLESGIVLTSGLADNVPGPNQYIKSGSNNGLEGHPLLEQYTAHPTYDACVLEFDFVPESDTLRFKYVFGSEEYNEWIGSAFNDVCGIFISGPNPDGGIYEDKNIAIVPGTTNTSVAVNHVNNGWAASNEPPTGPCTNCAYYSDNTFGLTLEYDGLTTVLVAWLKVVPYEEYHLLMGVADAGDHIGDAGVFLEENSIEAKFPRITADVYLQPPEIMDSMVEEFITADIVFKLLYPDEYPITFDLELNGTADPEAFIPDGGDFEEALPTEITFEEGEDSVVYQIKAVYDALIEGEEYLEMITISPYSNTAIYDTLVFNVLDYIEMFSQTSPDKMICAGQEVDIWAQFIGGYPPYTYSWEPGGYANDSISVSPLETTNYIVTCSDLFTSIEDSVLVTVFPIDYEIFSFSFEMVNNPNLFADVVGEIFEDSIALDVSFGTNFTDLVATFNLSDNAWAQVNGEDQLSGVTTNDFTNPVTYKVIAPGGCAKDWTVNVNLVTGQPEDYFNIISIFPNPANEKISINNAQGNTVTIINNLGVVLYKEKINHCNFSVELKDFEIGLYFLQFNNEKGLFVKKMIINR